MGVAFSLLTCLVFEGSARASSPEFLVEVDASCPTLRPDKITEHLEIEAQHEVQIVDGVWNVRMRCGENMVDVTARRPATGASASRLIPAPQPEDPQRERILALATLPLLRLATAEVAAIEAPALPPEAEFTPRPPAPTEADTELVKDMMRTDSVELSGGAGLGGPKAPFLHPRVGFGYAHWFAKQWGVRAGANVSFGSIDVSQGYINLVDATLSFGAAWRSRQHTLGNKTGRLQIELAFDAGAQYMHGWSDLDSVIGEPLAGPSGGASAALAYYFGVTPSFDLGLAVEGGWRAWGIIGRVNGIESASWIGPWGAASLRLRFGFNRAQD